MLVFEPSDYNLVTPPPFSQSHSILGAPVKSLLNTSYPLGKKFYTICEKYDTPYLLLGDILSEENPAEVSKKISEIMPGYKV